MQGLHNNCLADVAENTTTGHMTSQACADAESCASLSQMTTAQAPRHAGRSIVESVKGIAILSSCDFGLAGNHLLAPTPWADEQCGGVADGPKLLRLPDQYDWGGWESHIALRGGHAHQ